MTSSSLQVSITAVIVLYRQTVEESAAFQTLQQAYREASDTGLQLHTLLYDNTPGGQCSLGDLPANTVYMAASRNEGLAAAYNLAAAYGRQQGSDWLLTLDQDTQLPPAFLQQMAEIAISVADTPVIAAIVPQIVGDGRTLSPNRFTFGLPSWFEPGYHGVPSGATFAFNSASLVRLSALQQVGGYNAWFWLDNSDAFLFRQLAHYGKRVFVAGKIQVQHNFSMMDMKNRVSAARYHNILLAESAFWDLEMSLVAGLERTARLAVRFVKQIARRDPKELRATTVEFLKRRLFWSRKKRLHYWQRETQRLLPTLSTNSAPHGIRMHSVELQRRPPVSVCMAAYNGDRYIKAQLVSILHQLQPGDEILIVDDASTDQTVRTIQSMDSPLIRLIRHDKNRGVVATFDAAMRNAQGEILFLADNDDLWAPNKVELFLNAFQQHPHVDIVTSRVAFIDGTSRSIEHAMYDERKVFQSGFWQNLLRNHYQGSAMAIRASRLRSVLPFPLGVGFMHDQWIGMRNARAGGSSLCLDAPLLLYRRHQENLSGRMPRSKQIKLRLQLLLSHLVAEIRRIV